MRALLLLSLAACVLEDDATPTSTDADATDESTDVDTDETVVVAPTLPPLSCPPGTLRVGHDAASAAATMTEATRFAGFGATLAVGDVDGDGRADLVVGARLEDRNRRGAVYLVRGPIALGAERVLDGTVDIVDGVRIDDDVAGWSTAIAVLDLDRDGDDEVIATAPGWPAVPHDMSSRGLVAVLDATAFEGAPVTLVARGALADGRLGTTVVAWHDRHGRARVAVGEPGALSDDLYSRVGKVTVLGPDLQPVGAYAPAFAHAQVGSALAVAGDLDGDGDAELAVGRVDGSVVLLGGASVASGQPAPFATILAPIVDPPLGLGVPVPVGDQDGDGARDLLVHIFSEADDVLVPWPPDLPDGDGWLYTSRLDAGTFVYPAEARAHLSELWPVLGAHDLDGDGTIDLLVRRDPDLVAVTGPLVAARPPTVILVESPQSATATVVADLTGDGRPDLAVGYPDDLSTDGTPSGVVRVWELCPR